MQRSTIKDSRSRESDNSKKRVPVRASRLDASARETAGERLASPLVTPDQASALATSIASALGARPGDHERFYPGEGK
jgi:hypothetical protein